MRRMADGCHYIKATAPAPVAVQGIARTKGGSHLAVDRNAGKAGGDTDCSQALPLIEGIEAECLLADKAYDTNEIIAAVRELGMDPMIPPKRNRKEERDYDCTS